MKLLRRRLLLLYAVVCAGIVCMFAYKQDTFWISKYVHHNRIISVNAQDANGPTNEINAHKLLLHPVAANAGVELNATLFMESEFGKRKSGKAYKFFDAFRPVLRIAERRVLYDIIKTAASICESLNSTLFLYGGSLLGSYRHHGIIPWDDDIDVFANISDRPKLFAALNMLSPAYQAVNAGARVKFFSRNSKKTSKYKWKWPYIDIHFFKENATHIMDSSRDFHTYMYAKNITFPLHPRPLGGVFVNAPFDSYATLLATYYDLDKCSTYHYSHKFESVVSWKTVRVNCSKLRHIFPFVHRTASVNGIVETLVFNGEVIHSLHVNEPDYATPSPYTLRIN